MMVHAERRTFRNGWVSYFDSLSPQQQKSVLSFNGDDKIKETMMASKRYGNGGATFPIPAGPKDGYGNPTNPPQSGMSLRAYFAGQALVAMGTWTPLDGMVRGELIAAMGDATLEEKTHRMRAAFAVAAADALLAALASE